MEQETYVSCIKINGVRILPPLLTDEDRNLMNYYKKLALQVEDRLKTLSTNNDDSYNSDVDNSDLDSMSIDTVADCTTVIDVATTEENDIPPHNITRVIDNANSSPDSVNSHRILMTKPKVAETITVGKKPQVPKTLNIVPLTVSNLTNEKDEKDCLIDKQHTENVPKLVRQGSYVLDSPSPMLLAHMQMEETISKDAQITDYVPTPSKNVAKRREWNISQAKMDWESQTNAKEFVITDSVKSSNGLRLRRHSMSNTTDHKTPKSVPQTKRRSSLGMYQSTASTDSLQVVLTKESINEDNNSYANFTNKNDNVTSMPEIDQIVQEKNIAAPKSGRISNMINLNTNEESSTSGSVSSERENNDKVLPNENLCGETTEHTSNALPSNKLLHVFKEIQEIHKKQMCELMIKQQKEQLLLQKAFEKQQMTLLFQIKKTQGDNSILSDLDNNFPLENSTPNKNIKLVPINNINSNKELYDCPLDYVYDKSMELKDSKQTEIKSCQIEKIIEKEDIEVSDLNKVESRRKQRSIFTSHKNDSRTSNYNDSISLSVSRELFPLDSKTTHVPIFDNPRYTEKHIQAVNTINAYVRGYLVRRIMKTERIVALKNTYKEALHCMLKLHVDAPLNLAELNFHHRLQQQCDAASKNIVDLFAQSPANRMQLIAHDREIKRSRSGRPNSACSYSFATRRTLARKKMKEMDNPPSPMINRSYTTRSRCQTWASSIREKITPSGTIRHGIKRSTSAGAVRKPWR